MTDNLEIIYEHGFADAQANLPCNFTQYVRGSNARDEYVRGYEDAKRLAVTNWRKFYGNL